MYLYGAGGHAKVVIDVLLSQNIQVAGLFEDTGTKDSLNGIPVLPGIKLTGKPLPELDAPIIVCIGSNPDRAALVYLISNNFGTAIHSSAIVSSSASIGEGSVVLQGAIIQAETIIGKHVIINTDASIDHESIIEDFVHISPNATLCGQVYVGEGAHIGAGATIIPGIKIGKWSTVGAGAVVIRDIPDFALAVGNPARILAPRPPEEGGVNALKLEDI